MSKANSKYFSFPFSELIVVTEFSPFEWSSNLLACGTSSLLKICDCKTNLDQPEAEELACVCTAVREYYHPSELTRFAWSPQTVLSSAPQLLRFCTAAMDKKVRLFTSDLQSEDVVSVIGDHSDYVNDISFEPNNGELLATVCDDQMCRIFRLDGALETYFSLTSAGMSVSWHPSDSNKLMVAEKRGLIRMYSVYSRQAVMSLDCMHRPLLSADWSLGNSVQVACVAGSDWFIFDTSRSSRALETKMAHAEGAVALRWSPAVPHLLATLSRTGAEVKVFSCRTGQNVLTGKVGVSRSLSWHHHLPLLAVAGDGCVHVWFIDTV